MSGAIIQSLRERKKQKTRATIVNVALELFARNGYQQTTIAQIAEAADVSPRTVSTYFPAKEEMVFEPSGESKARLERMIRERDSGTYTMEALRAWIMSEQKTWVEDERKLVCQRQIIDSDEGLKVHERALLAEFEDVLAEGLAVDLEMDPGDLGPRMAAAAAVAVFDLLSGEGGAKRAKIASVDEQMAILDQALTFIAGGVTAMREADQGQGT